MNCCLALLLLCCCGGRNGGYTRNSLTCCQEDTGSEPACRPEPYVSSELPLRNEHFICSTEEGEPVYPELAVPKDTIIE